LCILRVHHGPDELRAAGDQHRTACPEGPDTPTYRRRASMARGGVVDTGAQIGPRIQGKIPASIAERMLATVFVAVGILVIAVQVFD